MRILFLSFQWPSCRIPRACACIYSCQQLPSFLLGSVSSLWYQTCSQRWRDTHCSFHLHFPHNSAVVTVSFPSLWQTINACDIQLKRGLIYSGVQVKRFQFLDVWFHWFWSCGSIDIRLEEHARGKKPNKNFFIPLRLEIKRSEKGKSQNLVVLFEVISQRT